MQSRTTEKLNKVRILTQLYQNFEKTFNVVYCTDDSFRKNGRNVDSQNFEQTFPIWKPICSSPKQYALMYSELNTPKAQLLQQHIS